VPATRGAGTAGRARRGRPPGLDRPGASWHAPHPLRRRRAPRASAHALAQPRLLAQPAM